MTFSRKEIISTALVFVALIGQTAFAHSRFAPTNVVQPRDLNPGIKIGPCGGLTASPSNLSFTGGQTVNVAWVETINHPGIYHFEVSPGGDTGWIRVKSVTDNQNDANMHNYTDSIRIPNISCSGCSMRLIQEMTDSNPSSFYYSCTQSFTVVQDPALPSESGGGGSGSPDDLGGGESNCHK